MSLLCSSVTLSNIIYLNLSSRFCVIDVIPVADILNIMCDCQFVYSVGNLVIFVEHHAWCSAGNNLKTIVGQNVMFLLLLS